MRYLATTATTNNNSHSATRRMIALSRRERQLKLQTNHSIAKSIVQAHPHTLIGLEELTGIRERTKRRTRRRNKHGSGTAHVSPKARRANRHASRWAFAELHNMIAYKAILAGSVAVKVDADYTLHADLVGARNIAMRTLCVWQDWTQTGQLPRGQRLAQMPRTVKPKLRALPGWRGTQNCGGVRMRAICESKGK
jgi:putative transposase